MSTEQTLKNFVLIVENESLVREAMEDILSADGFQAIGTCCGQDGIDTYQDRHREIGLVILDMRLPGMNGPDILKALRVINPSVKAIISSAYDENEIRTGFNGEPISAILRKPFSADSLVAQVRHTLAN